MKALKPAHELILNKILAHCNNIAEVTKAIQSGGVCTSTGMFLSPMFLETARCQEIGGLCSLLEVLEEMILGPDELKVVIDQLREITCHHAAFTCALMLLIERAEQL